MDYHQIKQVNFDPLYCNQVIFNLPPKNQVDSFGTVESFTSFFGGLFFISQHIQLFPITTVLVFPLCVRCNPCATRVCVMCVFSLAQRSYFPTFLLSGVFVFFAGETLFTSSFTPKTFIEHTDKQDIVFGRIVVNIYKNDSIKCIDSTHFQVFLVLTVRRCSNINIIRNVVLSWHMHS